MLLILLELCFSYGLLGNWSDSLLIDEARLFFEDAEPSYLSEAEKILNNLPKTATTNEILQHFQGKLNKVTYGLLNLTLNFRYYQPRASILNPIPDKQPLLPGWAITRTNLSVKKYNEAPNMFYHKLNNISDFKDKMAFIREMSHGIQSTINKYNLENFTQETPATTELKNISGYYSYCAINGRITKPEYYEILHSLIEEYKLKKNYYLSDYLLKDYSAREVHHFIEPHSRGSYLLSHDIDKARGSWPNDPNPDKEDSVSFFQSKREIVKIQIFFSINSPESPELIRWAHQAAMDHKNYHINLIMKADLTNQTEQRIAYAFWESMVSLGVRNTALFLIDAYKKHSFKRAYKATIPTTSWGKLKKLIKNKSGQTSNIIDAQKYIKEHEIPDIAVSINGEFIQDRPIFHFINQRVQEVANRLKKAYYNGDFSMNQRVIDFFRGNAINWKYTEIPIKIRTQNRLVIHNMNSTIVRNLIKKLANMAQVKKIPIVNINDTSLFTNEELLVLRLKPGEKATLVGALIYKEPLSERAIQYLEEYQIYVHLAGFPTQYPAETILLVLLIRSSMEVVGITRKPIRHFKPELYINSTVGSSLHWEICMNPLSVEMREVSDMMERVAYLEIANISYIPQLPQSTKSVPYHYQYTYRSMIETPTCNEKYSEILKPTLWNVVILPTKLLVSSIITYAYAPESQFVRVGDQTKAPLKENGYFLYMIQPGKYQFFGTTEKEYFVDSFIPNERIFMSDQSSIKVVDNDKNLNLLTFITDTSIIERMKVIMHTITANTTRNVKLWIVSDYIISPIPNLDCAILPCYFPHFIAKPSDRVTALKVWKFSHLEMFIPVEINRLLFFDQCVMFLCDISRFNKIDMEQSSIAMPVYATNKKKLKNKYYMDHSYMIVRMGRPYHTTNLAFINLDNWRKENGGCLFRRFLDSLVKGNYRGYIYDEYIINIMQLYTQILTLPEEVNYNTNNSPENLKTKALTYVITSNEVHQQMGVNYTILKKEALAKFN